MSRFTTKYDIVYNEHCSKCHLRHSDNCEFKNCSKETYDSWLDEAADKIKSNNGRPAES